MTREAYLNELTQLLKRQNTPDIDDIVAEYDAHFTYKTADGFTEEEVADKLGSPEQIAEQYLQAQTGSRRMGRGVLKFGFGLLDFVLALLFTVLYGWVIALGAFAAASAAAGLGLMFQAGGLPAAPLFAAIPLGLALIALGVLAAIETVYSHLYVVQWAKAFLHFQKNCISGAHRPGPGFHPAIPPRRRRRLRNTAIVSLTAFGVLFVASFIALCVYTGSFEFWHALRWFV